MTGFESAGSNFLTAAMYVVEFRVGNSWEASHHLLCCSAKIEEQY